MTKPGAASYELRARYRRFFCVPVFDAPRMLASHGNAPVALK